MNRLDVQSQSSEPIITDGGADRRILKCLVPLADTDGISRMADSASFLLPGRLSINISVSSGCVGRCARVCPSGLPKTLKMPMFSASEMAQQVDAHVLLRGSHCEGRIIDVGTFADGEPASNGEQVLLAAKRLLNRDQPSIHHMGISTIGFDPQKFLPAYLAAARTHAPGKLRLHYSFYGPGGVHDSFVPRPAPPVDDVFPMLATIGRESGFPVTLNIPMIANQTDTDENMERTAEYVGKASDAFRVKLSAFNPGEIGNTGERLEASCMERMLECAAYLRGRDLRVKLFVADKQDDGSHVEAGCGRLNIMTRSRMNTLTQR